MGRNYQHIQSCRSQPIRKKKQGQVDHGLESVKLKYAEK